MRTSQKILDYISQHGRTRAVDLVDYLEISDRAIRLQLKKLHDTGLVEKIGKPPLVYYALVDEYDISLAAEYKVLDQKTAKIIDDNFLYISPAGQRLEGYEGFAKWCADRSMDIQKTAISYCKIINKYNEFKKDGLVDGTNKFKTTFKDLAADKVFYADFYSIEIFGKTKLGQTLLFAKQSQDRKQINQIADEIKPLLESIIRKYNIDGVGYIPPTVTRNLQLMKQLEKRLSIPTRIVSINKIKTPVTVPQKTLTKLQDRITNARATINVDSKGTFKNILLIDDAIGSGATIHETAKAIKQKGLCSGKVIGFAITGSLKGFDIISEI